MPTTMKTGLMLLVLLWAGFAHAGPQAPQGLGQDEMRERAILEYLKVLPPEPELASE